jgi:hypothetical protein
MRKGDQLRAKRDRLAAKAPALGECVRGTVVARMVRCGKPTCACAEDDARRHGPYHYLMITLGRGKTKTVFIPADLVGEVRGWTANYARLKKTLEQVTATSCALIEWERGQDKGRGRR